MSSLIHRLRSNEESKIREHTYASDAYAHTSAFNIIRTGSSRTVAEETSLVDSGLDTRHVAACTCDPITRLIV
jgi:hypothetical protein